MAKVLRDASNRAGRIIAKRRGELSDAADALQAGGGDGADGRSRRPGQAGQSGQQQSGSASAQNGRSAAATRLNQLEQTMPRRPASASVPPSQLESSRNALERALGRTQSRSGSNGRVVVVLRSSAQPGRQAARMAIQSQGGGQGQSGDRATVAMRPGRRTGRRPGRRRRHRSGRRLLDRRPEPESDSWSRQPDSTRSPTPQQVPSNGGVAPDESSVNPYLGDAGIGARAGLAGAGSAQLLEQANQGNDSGSIPLGLRDLVKDYFSSLDQK